MLRPENFASRVFLLDFDYLQIIKFFRAGVNSHRVQEAAISSDGKSKILSMIRNLSIISSERRG